MSQLTTPAGHSASFVYKRSPKVGNPIASILKSNVEGSPVLIVLDPVFNFWGFTMLQAADVLGLEKQGFRIEMSKVQAVEIRLAFTGCRFQSLSGSLRSAEFKKLGFRA